MVESLSCYLDETIDICIDSLYNVDDSPQKIFKNVFRSLLNVDIKELLFIFNNRFCRDGKIWGLHWVRIELKI